MRAADGESASTQEKAVLLYCTPKGYDPLDDSSDPAPGYIDVWWLADEGGLLMLIPWLLANSPEWLGHKLNVYTVQAETGREAEDQAMLSEMGIKMTRLLTSMRFLDRITEVSPKLVKRQSSLLGQMQGLNELIRSASAGAALVFVNLPIPPLVDDSTSVGPELDVEYAKSVDALTCGLGNVIAMRGSQSEVISFN